jgi:hypothetical protein
MVRRWAVWKPWLVTGAGAVVVALGGLVDVAASNSYAAYDRAVAASCPHGCSASQLASLSAASADQSRGDVERAIAVALIVAGGAAIATGIAGVVANQPHPLAEHVAPAPLPGSGAMLSARWRF